MVTSHSGTKRRRGFRRPLTNTQARHKAEAQARQKAAELARQKAEQDFLLAQVLSPVWGGRPTRKTPPPSPSVKLKVSDALRVVWRPEEAGELELLDLDENAGVGLRPAGGASGSPRDVVMGLDLGTSSTKVVLADHSADVAYAVPFNDSVGVSRYLLPSVLIETPDGQYTLTGNGVRHADLKLAMLTRQDDPVVCSRVCAFLALTIRRARAWMFEAKRDHYLRSDIVWTLAIGLPSDQSSYISQHPNFMQLAKVAWSLAGRSGPLRVSEVREAWCQRGKLDLGDELEVKLLPELSAQIHGFVSSSHFDARQPSIYLMVDVGAGTLDASLFSVRKDRGGSVSFGLFTHSVEQLGAANLNRHRLGWWQSKLKEVTEVGRTALRQPAAGIAAVLDELEALKLSTTFRGRYPVSYDQYLQGVEVELNGGAKCPDSELYGQVRRQVIGKVLYRAWSQGLMGQAQLKGMPFFLCGGGARHPLYESLKSGLERTPSFSWLGAKYRELTLPSKVSAPGLPRSDYDRLSVAYGLSQLNAGAFEQVGALMPQATAPAQPDLESRFVDKSVC